jgi:hypothetical protein
LDADAYVYDIEFPIRQYLAAWKKYALVIEPGAFNGWWDVNAGVFFINMKHLVSQKLIGLWERAFVEKISDCDLKQSVSAWSLPHDQTILQGILRDNPEFAAVIQILERQTINTGAGKIIRQLLRGPGASLVSRIERAKKDIEPILSRLPISRAPMASKDSDSGCDLGVASDSILHKVLRDAGFFGRQGHSYRLAMMEEFTRALYRCLLLREPDAGGLQSAVDQLYSGTMDFESTLTACLRSPEFQTKILRFLERHVGPGAKPAAAPMDYVRLLALIKRILVPTVYLEVGVGGGATLASEPVPDIVIGIDPEPRLSEDALARLNSAKRFVMLTATSDGGFAELWPGLHLADGTVDLSFVDGLHHS